MKEMLRLEKWQHVEKLVPKVSIEFQKLAIDKIKQQKPEFLYESSVFNFYKRQLSKDSLITDELPYAVQHGHWEAVGKMMTLAFGTEQLKSAVSVASQRADEFDLVEFTLPHCPANVLETVMDTLVTRRLWSAVGMILEKGVDESLEKSAVEAAITNSSIADFVQYTFPHIQ
jgi:hypothetical protein